MRRITEGQYVLGALTAFAVWIFVVLPLLYYPRQETPNDYRGAAQSEQQPDSIGEQPPAFIALKLFTTAGRDEIAKYCAVNASKQKKDWTREYICDVKLTDAYIAAFNGLLVFVTCGLIGVGYFTIRRMRITERRQLRAYVFATVQDFQSEGNGWKYTIAFTNSGQTPAHDFTQTTMCNIFAHPPVEGISLSSAKE